MGFEAVELVCLVFHLGRGMGATVRNTITWLIRRFADVEEKLPSWKQMKRLWTSIPFFDIT